MGILIGLIVTSLTTIGLSHLYLSVQTKNSEYGRQINSMEGFYGGEVAATQSYLKHSGSTTSTPWGVIPFANQMAGLPPGNTMIRRLTSDGLKGMYANSGTQLTYCGKADLPGKPGKEVCVVREIGATATSAPTVMTIPTAYDPATVISVYGQDTSPRHFGTHYFIYDTPGDNDDTGVITNGCGTEIARRSQIANDYVVWNNNYKVPVFAGEILTFKKSQSPGNSRPGCGAANAIGELLILDRLDNNQNLIGRAEFRHNFDLSLQAARELPMPGPMGSDALADPYYACEWDEFIEADGYIQFPLNEQAFEYAELVISRADGVKPPCR